MDKARTSSSKPRTQIAQLPAKLQKQSKQQNKENNLHLFENSNRFQNRELQQSTVIEVRGMESEDELTMKRTAKQSKSNQKVSSQNSYQLHEFSVKKGSGQNQGLHSQDIASNESMIHKNVINSGSMSSSFCIPQAAQPHFNQANLPQQIISINNSDFYIGSLQQSNYVNNNNNNETLDSNGNEIRGRKIDSPHLLVVREIREMDEEEDREMKEDQIHGFGSGSDELMNLIWNSRDFRQQANNALNESIKKQPKQGKHSKSLESKGFRQQKQMTTQQKNQIKDSGSGTQKKSNSTQKYHQNNQRGGAGIIGGGTKSQRELRSSMGFNELLNQLDKDVSVNQVNVNVNDFKNRTVNDLLKLELSGIRRQYSQGGQKPLKNDLKNKTIGVKTTTQHQNLKVKQSQPQQQVSRSKSKEVIVKKTESGKLQYNEVNQIKKAEIEKLMGLIKQQTNRIQPESLLFQNGRTKSQSSLGASGSGQFKNITSLVSQQKQNAYPQAFQNNQSRVIQQKEQSSPERQMRIDKLVRDNIKRNKEKEEEERLLKYKQDETIKKKREDLGKQNSQVRLTNKQKTYKKHQEAHMNMQQQSQDPIGQSQGEIGVGKSNKIYLKKDWKQQVQIFNAFKMDYPNKSQSQKIEFEKGKQQQQKDKKSSFKNHRKSYGLEFIDIKKEIEEELRTLDVKTKNNLINQSLVLKQRKPTNANNTEQSIKKLKIKQKPFTYESQEKNEKDIIFKKGFGDKENKVVLVKKNRIRKFMKAKKKEMVKQEWKVHNEEISRTMKMQENLNKLNLFCKKSLEKQTVHKNVRKRNTTIQGGALTTDPDLSEQRQKDASKISHRKKDRFRRTGTKMNKEVRLDDDDEVGDSSKLSTEFYEEYFRLLNSIKKEQQESSSKILLSEVDLNGSNFTQMQRQLLKSPQHHMKTNSSHSPSSFQNNLQQQTTLVMSPGSNDTSGKQKKLKKGKSSKQQLSITKKSQSKGQLPPAYPLITGQQQELIQLKKTLPFEQSKSKNRAESAPLVYNNQLKKKVLDKSPSKKEKKKTKKKSDLSNSQKLHFLVAKIVTIQRFFRRYLQDRGFYSMIQGGYEYEDEDEISENEGGDYQTQVLDVNTVHKMGTFEKLQQIDDLENYGEYPDDLGSDFEDEDDQQLIIINPQALGDDNKIIYMSNINSCSLPQTPKEEHQPKKPQLNIDNEMINKVFEYQPRSNDLQEPSPPHFQNNEAVHWPDQKLENQYKRKDPNIVIDGINLPNHVENYGMRMLVGSESRLREFKLHTPKSSNPAMRLQDSNSKSLSVNGLSSQHSMINLQALQVESIKQSSNSLQNEHASQSSQSLFDRNSFQQFTMNKLNQIIQNNEFSNLINMREKALDYRLKKESKFIKKMFKNNQLSPRTYSVKKEQLEKWVQLEQEEILKTKKAFQEEWQKTVLMIEETQKNVELMREKMKISIDNNKHHQSIFNSQSSRNSSSNQSNIASVKQDPKRQLNIEDMSSGLGQVGEHLVPPLSQRSWKFNDRSSKVKPDYTVEESKEEHKPSEQEANLFEYLEQSWQKNQKSPELPKNFKLSNPLQRSTVNNDRVSRQGIYIEDQTDKIQSSQISDSGELENHQHIQQPGQQKLTSVTQNHDEERSLHRSRSEQDLKDLIRNNKLDDDDQYYDEEYQDELNSQQQSFINLEQNLKDKNLGQIIIQENKFDENEISQHNPQRDSFYKDIGELESNDSYLNESDLNKYFQDQQFSLEDFKSLDKKKLIEKHEEEEIKQEEEETARLLNRHEKTDPESQLKQQVSQTGSELSVGPKQELEELKSMIEDQIIQIHDQTNSELISKHQPPFFVQNIEYQKNRPAHTPDLQSSSNNIFQQQQQALLFSNAKPGENIRISDILKKTQSLNGVGGADSLNSILGDSSNLNNSSQFIFQNQQINQSISTLQPAMSQQDQITMLANQITEELLAQILVASFVLPSRPSPIAQEVIPASTLVLQPIENQDIFFIDAQLNEREQRRESIEARQRSLIESDLQKVEIYINEIIGTLLQSELQALTNQGNPAISPALDITNYHKIFLNVLTNPIKKNELDILNQLQTSEIGSYDHFETTIDQSVFPILPIDLYLEIERQREEQIINGTGSSDLNLESSIVQESVHIHNKAVFDALNESLMKFRPYGLQGEPMPWSNKNRRLQTRVDANSVDTERLFQMVKQDVLRWVATYSGCQPSPVFVFRKTNNQQTTSNAQIRALLSEQEMFDEEQFQETRERRLAQMLASEVVETEHQWLNYEFEEAQVKVDLSDMILEHLVEEVVIFFNNKKEQGGER